MVIKELNQEKGVQNLSEIEKEALIPEIQG